MEVRQIDALVGLTTGFTNTYDGAIDKEVGIVYYRIRVTNTALLGSLFFRLRFNDRSGDAIVKTSGVLSVLSQGEVEGQFQFQLEDTDGQGVPSLAYDVVANNLGPTAVYNSTVRVEGGFTGQ